MKLSILLHTADYVAVDKPAGLPVIPGRATGPCLLEMLAEQLRLPCAGSADPRLRVVHRIDRDTSGLVVFALHREAQRHLSEQFRERTVTKEYLALVAGSPAANDGDIDAPLERHPTNRKVMITTPHGRPARTAWRVERRFGGLALLRVFPKSGKTHQIRVHLRSIGLPLAIDPLYNASAPPLMLSSFKRGYRPGRDGAERPLIERLTLHAHKLSFLDQAGQVVELMAELPKDFRAAVNMLGKYAKG